MNQNQRYAIPPMGTSITESRPSDFEAMTLVSRVLSSGSPISTRFATVSQTEPQIPEKSIHLTNYSNTPVVPEFQKPSKMRETIDFPSQAQASTTTFTPINIDEIPIYPKSPQKEQIFGENYSNPKTPISPSHDFPNSTLASIEVPKYNFEEILEQALKAQEEGVKKIEEKIEKPKGKRKAKFLKRKKRYDPMEAIKKDKQKKSKSKGLGLSF